ncbi:MAG TPA: NTP transferase domain-containing protein, partial [Caulobacteraceae bacterium]|nr:NTP transferase domain-containing protein [Caulobacteraceae bacterium]
RVARAAAHAGVGPVVVAAGEAEIAEACRAAGIDSVLTDPALPSGSDRIMAALGMVDPTGRYDTVINLQGDMPFVEPATVQACEHLLRGEAACDIATVVAPESGPADRSNPDVVKAVVTLTPGRRGGRALYFTRSTLYGDGPVWRHVGIYGYRREALARFTAAPPSALEQREKLEQLRAMELGLSIWASVVTCAPLSVDSPADLEAARAAAERCR